MNGVEILAINEVVVNSVWNWTAFWFAFGAIFVISVIVGIIISMGSGDWSTLIISIVCGLIISALLGLPIADSHRTPTEYAPEYKVTVSNEVSMNDFMEKYEIVNQEGKIYTVRERD